MEWRVLPSCEFYEVSDQGDVRSLDRVISLASRNAMTYERSRKGQTLKPVRHSQGYLMVNVPSRRSLHSVVAEAFIGPRPHGYDINHKNGIKTDNRVENLEYCSRSDNMRHAVATGLCPKPPTKRGVEQHKAMLTEAQVLEIRDCYKHGSGIAEMARRYGVGESTIRSIVQRKTWAWLSDD